MSLSQLSDAESLDSTIGDNYSNINASFASNISRYDDTQQVPSMKQYTSGQGDPLIYIIGVLSFYILSITALLLKYVRTQGQEDIDEYYYNAFIKREGLGLGPHGSRMPMNISSMDNAKTLKTDDENVRNQRKFGTNDKDRMKHCRRLETIVDQPSTSDESKISNGIVHLSTCIFLGGDKEISVVYFMTM